VPIFISSGAPKSTVQESIGHRERHEMADKQKWSRSEFNALFADLGKIAVAIPTGTTDGAAGSLYFTAPVTITGQDKEGRPVRIGGEAVLRRVNDIDGATSAQLRWHFETLTLTWVH
jgi:hypothetical protein